MAADGFKIPLPALAQFPGDSSGTQIQDPASVLIRRVMTYGWLILEQILDARGIYLDANIGTEDKCSRRRSLFQIVGVRIPSTAGICADQHPCSKRVVDRDQP